MYFALLLTCCLRQLITWSGDMHTLSRPRCWVVTRVPFLLLTCVFILTLGHRCALHLARHLPFRHLPSHDWAILPLCVFLFVISCNIFIHSFFKELIRWGSHFPMASIIICLSLLFVSDKCTRWHHLARDRSSPRCLTWPSRAPSLSRVNSKPSSAASQRLTTKEVPSVWNVLSFSPPFGSI